MLSARGVQIGSKRCVIVFPCWHFEILSMVFTFRERVVYVIKYEMCRVVLVCVCVCGCVCGCVCKLPTNCLVEMSVEIGYRSAFFVCMYPITMTVMLSVSH